MPVVGAGQSVPGRRQLALLLRAVLTSLMALIVSLTPLTAAQAATARIKDIVNIEGVRDNQLVGYGLVVGLNGTGDGLSNSPFTKQSLQAMLERLGVNTRGENMRTGNVAAVMVTANLPPFSTQGSRLDVDVPDEIAQYGENQRFIGSWVLTKVNDPGADTPSDHQVPEYLVVMAPYKSGMPFDFDQVRVFTWSTRRHRYETAFRLRPIQGFLPVHVTTMQTPRGPVPAFSFQIAGDQNVTTDPDTGITRPVNPRTITYQMIDTQVKRVGPDLAPIPTMRANDGKVKTAQKAAKKKRR